MSALDEGRAQELDLNLPSVAVDFHRVASAAECAVRINDRFFTSRFAVDDELEASSSGWDSWWGSFLRGRPITSMSQDQSIRIADLFCGPGGLSLGVGLALQTLGIHPEHKLAVDVDQGALKVHQANHHTLHTYGGSAKDLVDFRVIGRHGNVRFAYPPEPLGDLSATCQGRIDLIVAGPPCQGHSTLNNHSRGRDPRNRLFLTVPAAAVAWNVPTVIIENVPSVVRDSEGVVESALSLFHQAGYQTSSIVFHANKMGWPQTRKRFFLIATTGPHLSPAIIAQALSRPAQPLSWAIGDLLDEYDENSLWTSTPQLSAENESRIQHLFKSSQYDLPFDKRPISHQGGTTYTSVYGRMRWDQPSGTITTGFMTPGRGRFVHPLQPRVLTPHEAARVQGFPDSYEFLRDSPRRQDLGKWLGDAVPSILGFAAGLAAYGLTPTDEE